MASRRTIFGPCSMPRTSAARVTGWEVGSHLKPSNQSLVRGVRTQFVSTGEILAFDIDLISAYSVCVDIART